MTENPKPELKEVEPIEDAPPQEPPKPPINVKKCKAPAGWDQCKKQFNEGAGFKCPKCGNEYCSEKCLKAHMERY
jgi:hypothetical protein